MENSAPRPDTINALRFGTDASFAMLAGMQLDVFTPLSNGSLTAEQIANAIGVAPTRLPLLLYALVAAGLLTEQDGQFANTPEAQHFLVKDSPSYMGNVHALLLNQWERKLKTAASLRTGIPQAYVDFSDSPPEEVEAFLRRINVITVNNARELLTRYDFSSIKSLVDVCGGGGGLAITMVKAFPQLQATVIDLPEVTPVAQKIVEEEGVADRVTIIASDVVNRPVPGFYDVAVMRTLLQVLPSEDAQRVVQNLSGAIEPGGTVYIVDAILDDSRLSPPSALSFNLFAINVFEAGAAYTEHEGREWLSAAGFVDIERASFLLAGGFGLMTARKRG
ncbi:MAG: methyltransferase [Candidatus Tectomicrobia bacterium]